MNKEMLLTHVGAVHGHPESYFREGDIARLDTGEEIVKMPGGHWSPVIHNAELTQKSKTVSELQLRLNAADVLKEYTKHHLSQDTVDTEEYEEEYQKFVKMLNANDVETVILAVELIKLKLKEYGITV